MRICLFLLVLFSFSLCQGQELYHRILNADNGLPSNKVHYVYEDSKGYIWFGTENGVCRWDSKNFVTYTIKDGLPNNEVLVIYEDSKGRIWFSTFSNELCYLQNDTIFNRKNDKRLEKIDVVKGSILSEVNNKLLAYSNHKSRFMFILETDLMTLKHNKKKIVYQGQGSIVIHKHQLAIISNFLININGNINRCAIEFNDSLFYFTEFNINKFDSLSLKIIDFNQSKALIVPTNHFFDLIGKSATIKFGEIELKKGHKFNSIKEVEKFLSAQTKWQALKSLNTINKIKSFSFNKESLFIDFTLFKGSAIFAYQKELKNEKSLLFPLNSSLIQMLNFRNKLFLRTTNNVYHTYNTLINNFKSNLENNSFHKIYKSNGQLNIIDENHFVYNPITEKVYKLPIFEKLYGLNYGESSQLYLVSTKSIINLETKKSITNSFNDIFSYFKGFSYSSKFKLYTINNSQSGLYVQDLNQKATKISSLYAYTSFIDSRNRLWIGTVNKLYLANKFLPKVKGEREIKLNKNFDIFCSEIKEDAQGNIFFTTNDGVYMIDKNDKKYHIDDKNFLSSNECVTLKLDTPNHSFFVATRNGVNHIGYHIHNGQLKFNVINKFFKEDGLTSNEIKDILIDGDSLWVASAKGLDLISDKNYSPDSIKIPVHFNKIFINDSIWKLDTFYHLDHTQNNLKIDYSAIYYQRRDRLDIRYRLIKDSDTSEGKIENPVLQLFSLASGSYTLQMYAFDRDYPYIHSDYRTLRFEISPPYYKTWWFYSLILLSALSILGGLMWYRNKNKLEQVKLIGELNKYKLQGLQNQMNPHFVFNSMSTIQDLILTEQNVDALDFISDFSHLMRTMLQNSRNETISLTQEINFLKRYIELEQIRYSQTFDYKFETEIPEEELNDIYIPTMMIQPIVENAIKHGVSNLKERRGRVHIRFSSDSEETFLTVNIIDNGQGKSSSSKSENHTSTAINVIQERLHIYTKNDKKGEYKVEYSDKGTKAELILPI